MNGQCGTNRLGYTRSAAVRYSIPEMSQHDSVLLAQIAVTAAK